MTPDDRTHVSLRYISTSRCDGPFGSAIASQHYTDTGARVVRLQNIRSCDFDSRSSAFIDEHYFRTELVRHDVLPGDVLVAGLGDENNPVGRACVAPECLGPALVKADCFRFRIDRTKAEPRFIAYALSSSATADGGELSNGSTRQRITLSAMANRKVPRLSLSAQVRIANFLDEQTARIEALISEKGALLERLTEYERSRLWSLVTKGVAEPSDCSESGVEWIGETPSHWRVAKLKWLTPVLRGASPRPIDDPKYFNVSGEYAWVRIADVSASDGVLTKTLQLLSELGASLSVKREPGDLFLSIAGTVGKPCIAGIKCCIHDGFVWFPRVGHGELRDWLFTIFETGFAYAGLGKIGTQLNLNTDTVGNIRVPLPPLDEMRAVLEEVKRVRNANRALWTHTSTHISLLREYRSSLISAAVTGQLDIQNPGDLPTTFDPSKGEQCSPST